MKRLLVCTALLAAAGTVFAQGGGQAGSKPAPASPKTTAMGKVGDKSVGIVYSSPRVKGREGKVFGPDGLIAKAGGSQYPIWRAGANEATSLMTESDIMLGDLKVPTGAYTLFVDITDPDNWELIVNKKTGEWGLSHDAAQDLGKVKMTMSKPPSMVEDLTWTIGNGGLTLVWENKQAFVPLSPAK